MIYTLPNCIEPRFLQRTIDTAAYGTQFKSVLRHMYTTFNNKVFVGLWCMYSQISYDAEDCAAVAQAALLLQH